MLRCQSLVTVGDINEMQNIFFRRVSWTICYIPSTSMNASRELSEKKVVFIASMNFIEQNLTSESHFPLVLGYSAFFASLPPPPPALLTLCLKWSVCPAIRIKLEVVLQDENTSSTQNRDSIELGYVVLVSAY